MNKYFSILAFVLLVLVGCKKETTPTDVDAEQAADTTVVESQTTDVDTTMTDTAVTDGTDVDLPNKLSVEKTMTYTDPADGRFTLSENRWLLSELNGKAVSNKTSIDFYINLDSKSGKFSGFAGCNNINGDYTMKKAGKLAFSKVTSTRKSCQDLKTETDFMAALAKVDNYMVEGDMLHLHKGKVAVAKFKVKK